jgi:anti-anti-sigma factor
MTDSELAVAQVEPGQLVQLAGRLDVHTAADVRLALADALELGEGELVIDLASLEGVDATGLGVLVGAHRRAGRTGRTLVLRDVTPPVHRVLFLTRLNRVLRLSTTDAA